MAPTPRNRASHSATMVVTATSAPEAIASPQQDVSVTEETLPRSYTLLTVTVSPRLASAQYKKEMAFFQKNTQVPGFRKGGKKGKKARPQPSQDTSIHFILATPW